MTIKSIGRVLGMAAKTGKRKKPAYYAMHEGVDPWGQPAFQPVSFRAKSRKAFTKRIKKHGWGEHFGIGKGRKRRGKVFTQNTPDMSEGTARRFKVIGTRKSGKYFTEVG